jgi:hypothetical protein
MGRDDRNTPRKKTKANEEAVTADQDMMDAEPANKAAEASDAKDVSPSQAVDPAPELASVPSTLVAPDKPATSDHEAISLDACPPRCTLEPVCLRMHFHRCHSNCVLDFTFSWELPSPSSLPRCSVHEPGSRDRFDGSGSDGKLNVDINTNTDSAVDGNQGQSGGLESFSFSFLHVLCGVLFCWRVA